MYRFCAAIAWAICFFSGFISAQEPLLVELDTADERTPVTVLPAEGCSAGDPYGAALSEVLFNDLAGSGVTTAVAPLKGQGAVATPYAAALLLQTGTLSSRLINKATGRQRLSSSLPLTMNLDADRRLVHRLADAIVEEITGVKGVASGRILYTRRDGDGLTNKWISQVWECDYDGANAHPLTEPQEGYCVTPCYLPHQGGAPRRFLYVSYATGQPKIYIGDGTGPARRLMLLPGNQLMPAVAPQGHHIAFISDCTGNPDLFAMPYDPTSGLVKKPRQLFIAPHATQGSPAISPDGNRLAFVSNKDGAARIYVLSLQEALLKPTRHAKLITRVCRDNGAPAWSPDGSQIAYCAMSDGYRQIWVWDSVSDSERQVTFGAGHKENPSWAPNSRLLIYNSNVNDGGELFVVDSALPGAVPRQISRGAGHKRFPQWSP